MRKIKYTHHVYYKPLHIFRQVVNLRAHHKGTQEEPEFDSLFSKHM
jgi:hypothetical protein